MLRPQLGGGVNDGGSGGETNGDTVSYEDLSAANAVTVNLETDSVTGAVTQSIPNVENARGGAGGDTLIGDAATNRLEGLAGDDVLRPKAGGGVNDGGTGGETIGDTVTYQDLVAAVIVDLAADTVTGAVTQTVPNVENATGGGGNDTLIGDNGDNNLSRPGRRRHPAPDAGRRRQRRWQRRRDRRQHGQLRGPVRGPGGHGQPRHGQRHGAVTQTCRTSRTRAVAPATTR